MLLFLILASLIALNAFAYRSGQRAERFENRRGSLYPTLRRDREQRRPFQRDSVDAPAEKKRAA